MASKFEISGVRDSNLNCERDDHYLIHWTAPMRSVREKHLVVHR